MFTRRDFCLTAGAATAATVLPASRLWARRVQDQLTVEKLRDGIWAILAGGGNSMLIQTKEGSILIDTKLPNVVDELLNKSKGLTGEPPKLVINTHHHGDHTGGNYLFSPAADLIAHKNVRPRLNDTIEGWIKPTLTSMARQADRDKAIELTKQAAGLLLRDFAADVEIEEDHTVERGGVKIELRHRVPGHTDNDAFLFMPEVNILHTGDLFFNQIHPYMDVPAGANSSGWRESVRAAIELCDDETVVVPGHGPISDRTGLQGQVTYFDRLEEEVRKAMALGQADGRLPEVQIEEYKEYDGDRLLTNLTNIHIELLLKGDG